MNTPTPRLYRSSVAILTDSPWHEVEYRNVRSPETPDAVLDALSALSPEVADAVAEHAAQAAAVKAAAEAGRAALDAHREAHAAYLRAVASGVAKPPAKPDEDATFVRLAALWDEAATAVARTKRTAAAVDAAVADVMAHDRARIVAALAAEARTRAVEARAALMAAEAATASARASWGVLCAAGGRDLTDRVNAVERLGMGRVTNALAPSSHAGGPRPLADRIPSDAMLDGAEVVA
jgi:hypothetical protein